MFTNDELEIIKTCLHEAIMDGNGTQEMGALMAKIVMMIRVEPGSYDEEDEDNEEEEGV